MFAVRALVASALVLAALPAGAMTITFSGQDDGASSVGPWPNSAAAQAAFKAAAVSFGTVRTFDFESVPLGYYTPVSNADVSIAYDSQDFGVPISGVNDSTLGGLYGFNVTPGGTNWLGFPDFETSIIEISFTRPTHSVGAWITGVQTQFTASIEVELVDGTMENFFVPLNDDGGAQFFGLVADALPFTKVIVRQTSPGAVDFFGVDDISYNVVPEPGTWAMMIAGFGLVGAAVRRRKALAAA
jgi:hypothetical protein